MNEPILCDICGHEIDCEKPAQYDGGLVHHKCMWDDIDSVGFDDEFGDR